jgi:hypothetical protein
MIPSPEVRISSSLMSSLDFLRFRPFKFDLHFTNSKLPSRSQIAVYQLKPGMSVQAVAHKVASIVGS